MTATTGYQAGTESNAAVLSYGVESVWATLPSTQFQAIRFNSETLAFNKTRQRPGEVPTNREAIAAVTTKQEVAGAINFSFSYGTFDDLLSVLLGADWQAAQSIAGASGDITITNVDATHATLSSTTGTKFQNIASGQCTRTLGFTNAGNNDIWRVTAKADNSHLTLVKLSSGGAPVTETPAGTAAQVRAQTITNGGGFKSLYFQKKLASALFLRYPGCYVSSWSLSGGVGSFLTGSFNLLAQQEVNATTDASTGSVLAAPTGRVNDPVGGWAGWFLNDVAVGSVLEKFSISGQNTGAASEFGMGNMSVQGMLAGLLEGSATADVYFRDFTLYQSFLNETAGRHAFITKDASGNAYVISLVNANIIGSKINAGGPNQPVMAQLAIEANPQSAGGTIQIDKLPAT